MRVGCRSPGLQRAQVPSSLLGIDTGRKSELTKPALGELLRIFEGIYLGERPYSLLSRCPPTLACWVVFVSVLYCPISSCTQLKFSFKSKFEPRVLDLENLVLKTFSLVHYFMS